MFHVNLYEEKEMQFDAGLVKDSEFLSTLENIKKHFSNSQVMDKLADVTAINAIKRLDGTYYINQLSGYSFEYGTFCYLVNLDGTLTKAL